MQRNIGKKLERYFKGASNHRRIEILFMLEEKGGLALEDISEKFNISYQTVGEHARKLNQAGLINKRNIGKRVEHYLSPYGERFVKFMKTF